MFASNYFDFFALKLQVLMSSANTVNNFMTGFTFILMIDILIFFTGLIMIYLFSGGSFMDTLSTLLVILIGIYQYVYVIPTVIHQLIRRNNKFAYGFLTGSLLVLSISIAIGISLEDSLGSFPIII